MIEDEVKQLPYRFFELIDQGGYLADFFEILDPEVEINYQEHSWKGWRGVEDHNRAVAALFDRNHEISKIDVSLHETEAIITTQVNLKASFRKEGSVKSEQFGANGVYAWIVKPSPEGKPRISSLVVEMLDVYEGKIPSMIPSTETVAL